MIRDEQWIIGWSHPTGSGTDFMREQTIPKNLKIVDLDNIYPTIYYQNKKYDIPHIPRNFIKKNSVLAGLSATMHALVTFGKIPDSHTKIAVLSSGNVAQGAFTTISKFTTNVQMYYRKTMPEFYQEIETFDIIVNGIEVDNPKNHIINAEQINKLKKGCLVIDAAADAGNAIFGTHYTTLDNPIYEENGIFYYEVNNAPTIFFRDSSVACSEAFSKWCYSIDLKKIHRLINCEE